MRGGCRPFGSLAALLPLTLAADDEPAATPYRPSVAGGAFMSRPGWLEVEFAGQRSGGNHTDRRDNLPYLLKLALSENWRVLLKKKVATRRFV